jgi:Tfp pilus assembly protein PilO
MQNQQQPAPPKPTKMSWKINMGILIGINILFVLVTIFLVSQMSTKGKEMKELRTKQLATNVSTSTVAQEELEKHKEHSDKVLSVFPDDDQLIEFVAKIDELKRAGGVTGFSFASDLPIKDPLGLLGLPVLVEMKGSLDQVNQSVVALQNLPFILRPVKTEIEKNDDGTFEVRWGGFLYVDQNFGKTQ